MHRLSTSHWHSWYAYVSSLQRSYCICSSSSICSCSSESRVTSRLIAIVCQHAGVAHDTLGRQSVVPTIMESLRPCALILCLLLQSCANPSNRNVNALVTKLMICVSHVSFQAHLQIALQLLGPTANAQHQHASGHRIKGATMAHLNFEALVSETRSKWHRTGISKAQRDSSIKDSSTMAGPCGAASKQWRVAVMAAFRQHSVQLRCRIAAGSGHIATVASLRWARNSCDEHSHGIKSELISFHLC